MIRGDELLRLTVEYRPSLQTQHLGLFGAMTVTALAVGYWIYRTRRTRGASLFAATLLLLGVRTGSDVVHGLVGELWTLQAVLVAANPLIELCLLVVFVRFAGRYAGVRRFSTDRVWRGMASLVTVAAVVVATNPIHGLAFTAFGQVNVPFTHVAVRLGPLGFVLLAVNGGLLLVGAGLLVHTFTRGSSPAWWPATVTAIGVTQATLVGGLQLTVDGVLLQYDYGAIGLGGFVFLATLAVLDHGLRRIEVVARGAILDEIDDAVVLLDADENVVDYNPAATRLFSDVEVGESFLERFEASDRPPLGAGTTRTDLTLEIDENGQRPVRDSRDGPESDPDTLPEASEQTGSTHFLVHTTSVTDETNETLGYAVRFVDVTELERRSRELRRKNDQLDQFASTVSHDLRNPLSVATGYLEMAFEPVETSDGTERLDVDRALTFLGKVEVSIDRMNAIIEDILALIEHADPVTHTESVEFAEVATAAWETVETGGATMRVETAGHVEADPDRLQRLLENLFRNAIDHVGGDVAIEAGLADTAFYVADDGPGVPEADRDRIFEHGYTTGEDGTGLGLSIVKRLAEAHGWTVSFDPDHDGARFVVSGCQTSTRQSTASSAE